MDRQQFRAVSGRSLEGFGQGGDTRDLLVSLQTWTVNDDVGSIDAPEKELLAIAKGSGASKAAVVDLEVVKAQETLEKVLGQPSQRNEAGG